MYFVLCSRAGASEAQSTKHKEQSTVWLILRHARIDLVRPADNSPFQVHQFAGEAGALQRVDRACAAAAHLAVHDGFAVRIDLVHAREHLSERDVDGVGNARDRDFVVFAHVDDLNIFAVVEALF